RQAPAEGAEESEGHAAGPGRLGRDGDRRAADAAGAGCRRLRRGQVGPDAARPRPAEGQGAVTSRRAAIAAVAVAVAVLIGPAGGVAHADENKAKAIALFDEGIKEMKA